MWLCDVEFEGISSTRDFTLFRLSFLFLSPFSSLVLFLSLERLVKVENCEHSPAGLGDVRVIASCIAAGF